jgi:hypothetical protein
MSSKPTYGKRPFYRRKIVILSALIAVALIVAIPWIVLALNASRELDDAFSEADRLDPGWRIEEIEANRKKVPDAQNSALFILALQPLVPPNWPFWWHRQPPEAAGYTPEQIAELERDFSEREPVLQLTSFEAKALRQEIARAAKALAEARKVADMPWGRYPIQYAPDGISTALPHVGAPRELAMMLNLDARLRCQDGDLEGALVACRGIFYAGRSLGDEPILISMLVRIAIRNVAIATLERILAQGTLPDNRLTEIQRLLEEDADEPLLWTALRGERAIGDCLMQSVQSGRMTPWQAVSMLKMSPQRRFEDIEFAIMPGSVLVNRAALLRYNNRVVQNAKLPIEQQKPFVANLKSNAAELPILARICASHLEAAYSASHRDQTLMRCAIAMVALERYRMAHRHWPAKLDELVGGYLKELPSDPGDGKPLKYCRETDGVIIYALGPDGQDHGGKIGRMTWKPGFDYGLRLWDVDKRRQR